MRMTPYSVYWQMPRIVWTEISFAVCRMNIKTGKIKWYNDFEKTTEIKTIWRF